jgi:hypothetical protein
MRSRQTARRLRLLVVALACAALAAPATWADDTPREEYGPLDPWAQRLIDQRARTVAGQASAADDYGPLDPWAQRLIDERARTTAAKASIPHDYEPLDPWAQRLIDRSASP